MQHGNTARGRAIERERNRKKIKLKQKEFKESFKIISEEIRKAKEYFDKEDTNGNVH